MDNINAIKHGIINGIGISILPKEQVKKDEQFGLLKAYHFNDAVIKRMLYVVYKNKHICLALPKFHEFDLECHLKTF